jgi:hypothetical protein
VPATLYINSTAFTALLTAWVMVSSTSAFCVSENVFPARVACHVSLSVS